MKISLNQRRFLIVWCLFHLLALITNLVPIKGQITQTATKYNGDISYDVGYRDYVFTYGHSDYYGHGFWPFVKMYDEQGYKDRGMFLGVFYDYNLGAFIVYILLGFAIVFLPKLWNTQTK